MSVKFINFYLNILYMKHALSTPFRFLSNYLILKWLRIKLNEALNFFLENGIRFLNYIILD